MRLDRLAPIAPAAPMANRSRSGFTLVELMVAMALSLFLMTILAEAFAVSMDTFRGLRAIGDMQDTLRNSLRQMRDDLAAPHFEGGRRLSDAGFWLEPRREGFFYMRGTAAPPVPPPPAIPVPGASSNGFAYLEGVDGNNVMSSRATDHVIHFTVRRQGSRPSSFFTVGPYSSAPLPRYTAMSNPPETYYGQLYNGPPQTPPPSPYAYVSSQWAEVAYVLQPMAGSATVPEAQGTPPTQIPLYNLYRAQVLVLPYIDGVSSQGVSNNSLLDGTPGGSTLQRFSVDAANNFYSPNDLANSATKRGFNSKPPAPPTPGIPNSPFQYPIQVSLVCSNVISFQVRPLVQQRTPAAAALVPMQMSVGLVNIQDLSPTTIDTAAQTTTSTYQNTPVRIMGLQIRLRIYDPASGQARQNTLVQAL